jgi:cytochrome c-type biogenesis protein CcmE
MLLLVYQGQISKDENGETVTVKEYSDLLAIFALKGLFPDKYRDNQAGIVLQGPTQINITIKGDSSLPSTAQDLVTCDVKKDEQD